MQRQCQQQRPFCLHFLGHSCFFFGVLPRLYYQPSLPLSHHLTYIFFSVPLCYPWGPVRSPCIYRLGTYARQGRARGPAAHSARYPKVMLEKKTRIHTWESTMRCISLASLDSSRMLSATYAITLSRKRFVTNGSGQEKRWKEGFYAHLVLVDGQWERISRHVRATRISRLAMGRG